MFRKKLAVLMAGFVFGAPGAVRAQVERIGKSTFEQAGAADAIMLGKVTAIEPHAVAVENPYNGGKADPHLIATVRVEEGLFGVRGMTHIRVAFSNELPAPPRDPQVKIFL